MLKRTIALLLVFTLCLGMFPVQVFAEDTASGPENTIPAETTLPVETTLPEETTLPDESVPDESVPEESLPAEPPEVTRGQWLSLLVNTFDYTLDPLVTPDDYYTDLTPDHEYYEDIQIAIYHGLVDLLPNNPMEPDGPATREFAAFTLNICIGGIPVSEGYSFSEAETVSHPKHIQVAIERNWLELTDGCFLPEQPITEAEQETMISYAQAHLESLAIDEDHVNSYTFKEGVVEITDYTEIEFGENVSQIKIYDISQPLEAGDTFVAYHGGLAIPFRADALNATAEYTEVTATNLYFEDAIETMDVQMTQAPDPLNFYAEEGTELIFIEEQTGQEVTAEYASYAMQRGSTNVYIPKFVGSVEVLKGIEVEVEAELTNSVLSYNVDVGFPVTDLTVTLETDAKVTGKLSATIYEYYDGIQIPLGGYEIPGVGGIVIMFKVDISGSVSIVKQYHTTVGITLHCIGMAAPIPTVFFQTVDSGSAGKMEASGKIFIEIQIGLTGRALPVKGYVYGDIGFKASLSHTHYTDTTYHCNHFSAHMFTEFGARIEWGLKTKHKITIPADDKFLITEENSPIKIVKHIENGVEVPECTRKDLFGITTGDISALAQSGYITGADSPYASSGMINTNPAGNDDQPLYRYSLYNGQATIEKYRGQETHVSIPSTLDGYPVVGIGKQAFSGNNMETVIMPDTIYSIDEYAFSGCTKLRNISFSKSLLQINQYAFHECTSLTTALLPDSVRSIGFVAFAGCSSLQHVRLPKSLYTIESRAFYRSGVRSVEVRSSTMQFKQFKYFGSPFEWCPQLKKVTVAEGVTSIGAQLFSGCTGLETVILPDSLVSIGKKVFEQCSSLTSIDLPDSLQSIGDYAFSRCSALENIKLPDSLLYIGRAAFFGCSSIKELHLPEELIHIDSEAFNGCGGLTSVRITKTMDHTFFDGSEVYYSPFKGCTSLQEIIIDEDITKILPGFFNGCSQLTTVKLPDSVETIGAHAFANCPNLTRIEIPDSVSFIDYAAFMGNPVLSSIKLPANITSIPDSAFRDCPSLTQIDIPESVASIGSFAFYNCDGLVRVALPDSVSTIGEHAFSGCNALTHVTMGDRVTSMGKGAFSSDPALQSIKLSNQLDKIPESAFEGCSSLPQIIIPYYATTIESKAFADCTNLAKVVTRSGLTFIDLDSFPKPDITVFYGDAGSYTETLAIRWGYTFVVNDASAETITVQDSLLLNKGTVKRLNVTVAPEDHVDVLTFTSRDPSVASVDSFGNITGVELGTAVIDIQAGEARAFCEVTVVQPVTGLSMAEETVSLGTLVSTRLAVEVTPANAYNQRLVWTSSDKSVATVDETGLVTGHSEGSAIITASTTDGTDLHVSCTVEVANIPVQNITLNEDTLNLFIGQTFQLTASVYPETAFNKTLSWDSGNESVATVDENGLVRAVGSGIAVIHVFATDESYQNRNCTVYVAEDTVHLVTDPAQLESQHNYPNNSTDFWFYSMEGAANLSVSFDEQTWLEDNYDFLYIYDGQFNLIGQYSGGDLAGKTVSVPGDTLRIRLMSDESVSYWGFRVTGIEDCDHLHSYTSEITQPTCKDQGFTTYTCTLCGTSYVQNYVEPLDHSFEWVYDDGTYHYRRCAACGFIPLEIIHQPADVCADHGSTAAVSTVVSGEGLTYAWYVKAPGSTGFSKSTDFTGPDYTVAMGLETDGQQVYCIVTDRYGIQVQTDTATLTMQRNDLYIGWQSRDVQVWPGETAEADVDAYGDGLTYEWYFKNPGSTKFSKTNAFTGPTYSVTMSAARDGRQVYCVVTDLYGNQVQSEPVTLSMMKNDLSIAWQTWDVTVPSGEPAEAYVEASGDGLTYEWYFKNPGSTKFSRTSAFTGPTYSVTMSAARDGRQVYCVITDQYGNQVQSEPVTLSMTRNDLFLLWQTRDVKVPLGETAEAYVEASGDGLTYEWYFKNPGSTKFSKTSAFTGPSYSVTMTGDRAGRQVYCVITDQYGNQVQSEPVTLSTTIQIIAHPQDAAVPYGQTVEVSVEAVGKDLTYAWYYASLKSGSGFRRIPDCNSPTCTISMAVGPNEIGYMVRCIITDPYGNHVASDIATLTVTTTPLRILTEPQSVCVPEGEKAVVTVEAEGDGLTYAWYYKNPGASRFSLTDAFQGNAYSVTMTAARDGRQVYCVITDACGNSLTTVTAELTMEQPAGLEILTQPEGFTIEAGETGEICVEAVGDGLVYEWYYKNAASSKFTRTDTFTGPVYSLTMNASRSGRHVYCLITDKYGNRVQTDTVTVNMASELELLSQPEDVAVAAGKSAAVTVDAVGEGLRYTWYYRNPGSETFTKTDSFTGDTYSLKMTEARSGRQVYCVVKDETGNTVATDIVTLSIKQQ